MRSAKKFLIAISVVMLIILAMFAFASVASAGDGQTFLGLTIDPDVLTGLRVALVAILIDTLFGWLFAIVDKKFTFKKMPQFLAQNILPYGGALLIAALATILDPTWKPIFLICVATVTAKFGWEAVKEKLLGRFNRPETVT
ncbi:MAG: hypothetical protein ACYCX4_17975 [Bacillota bacterium]